jgi:hypothetical protein
MAYPSGATNRVRIDPNTLEILATGVKTTKRTLAMIKAARFLFKVRGGGTPPKIVQGGYNPGKVGASSGTHDEDAIDFATKLFSEARSKLWERCVWEVGFASWRRIYIAGLWSAHTHSLPKGGQLSPAADRQIVQWHQGDDALRSDRDYPGILTSGLVARTWESFLSASTGGHAALVEVQRAFSNGSAVGTNDITQIQTRLNLFMASNLLIDGIPGPATAGVMKTFESRALGSAMVVPDRATLELLGFEVTL